MWVEWRKKSCNWKKYIDERVELVLFELCDFVEIIKPVGKWRRERGAERESECRTLSNSMVSYISIEVDELFMGFLPLGLGHEKGHAVR